MFWFDLISKEWNTREIIVEVCLNLEIFKLGYPKIPMSLYLKAESTWNQFYFIRHVNQTVPWQGNIYTKILVFAKVQLQTNAMI